MIAQKYKKIIRAMAKQRFPNETERILERADRQYDAFRKITPDIGGRKNMQFKDLDFLIAFFAFYEACDRRIGIPELDEFAGEVVVKPAEAVGRFIGWNSPLMAKLATKMYAGYKKKIDRHTGRGEWGNTWRVEMNPEGHTEGFAIHTRMCPNVDFCRAHGYEGFLPAICAQDYRIAAAMHGVLIRTHTVAQGDDCCDWWYFGDRQALPEEAKKRLSAQNGAGREGTEKNR
ncbi:MAG: L-2-amino-thiazoline-4-carboxylic acid hydrolase [Solobacterium sp.]|nr:L-2-amino-thiazoline-4-carboxylic acid hydrolase [Solobacterium sp.]